MSLEPQEDKTPDKGKELGDKSTKKERKSLKPTASDVLAGEVASFISDLTPYLPQDLVGGGVPYVPGSETEAVWNAASQACGTEKVNFVYSVDEDRVWYLACPSSSLASNPDSWCPLAAALPGNSEYWDKETVYLYELEGQASALRWDPDTGRMQVYLGASRTILPRVQSMDANFVTINADVADIVPWHSRSLRSEKLARATVRMLLFSGMLVSLTAFVLLLFNYASINMLDRNLAQVKRQADESANKLMLQAVDLMRNDTSKHMVCIQDILDGLAKVDGTLVRYEVTKKKEVKWEALVPDAFAEQFGKAIKQEDGRVRIIGNRKFCR